MVYKVFIATLCLIGFQKCALKWILIWLHLELILEECRMEWRFGLMMAASRLFSFGHSSHSTTESMENGEHTGNSEAMGTSSGMGDGAGPIPMSTGNPMDMEEMGEDYVSGNPLEEGYADNADDGKTADTVSDQENILDEMGITSQQEDMKNPEASTENYGLWRRR